MGLRVEHKLNSILKEARLSHLSLSWAYELALMKSAMIFVNQICIHCEQLDVKA